MTEQEVKDSLFELFRAGLKGAGSYAVSDEVVVDGKVYIVHLEVEDDGDEASPRA